MTMAKAAPLASVMLASAVEDVNTDAVKPLLEGGLEGVTARVGKGGGRISTEVASVR